PRSDHENVPPHEIMSESEVKELCKEKGITTERLPKILSSDPQSVKLQAKPGDVLKIYRSDNGNEFLYYRIVVEG
ncbi:MAG: DNA-directed RNA polymerase subunit H, partial [Candidatus Micrarchaeota archaeon]|nr:DNA-directed RNA polymerase subunit H [Candidatus Micrarchaeota archaeon]